jgi:hypothetical protein
MFERDSAKLGKLTSRKDGDFCGKFADLYAPLGLVYRPFVNNGRQYTYIYDTHVGKETHTLPIQLFHGA